MLPSLSTDLHSIPRTTIHITDPSPDAFSSTLGERVHDIITSDPPRIWADRLEHLPKAVLKAYKDVLTAPFKSEERSKFFKGFAKGLLIVCAQSLFTPLRAAPKTRGPLGFDKSYTDFIINQPFSLAIAAPISEELFFRGVLQTGLTKLFTHMTPSASTERISKATHLSIATTALIFALIHLANLKYVDDHSSIYMQCVFAFFAGIIFGKLKETEGLSSSIGAHMANNLFICLSVLAVHYASS